MEIKKYFYICFVVIFTACQSDVKFSLPEAQQQFGQDVVYNNKVDVIWVVDNSSSMEHFQKTLQVQGQGVIDTLNRLKWDYHIAIITTDFQTGGSGGKFVGEPKFLSNKTDDVHNRFKERLVQGEKGSNKEEGLRSLELVLSPSYLANDGAGFLRNEALLVVNVLSDENDQSDQNAQHYIDLLNKLKGSQGNLYGGWVFNFIGITKSSDHCENDNSATVGQRYIDIANASGGIKESICQTNFSKAVENIQVRVISMLTDFKLDKIPDVSTIRVSINGAMISLDSKNGWTYEADINVIRFHGTAVPPADASIKIDYKPMHPN